MHESRKWTNCWSCPWVAINRAAIARNALTLPGYPRYCVFHKKIKIHLAVQRQQLWALQKHTAKQEKELPWSWTVHFLDCPQVISNCCGDEQAEREQLWEKKQKKRGQLNKDARISKTMNYNSNKLNGHKIQVPELNRVDSPLSAYWTVRQPREHLKM